MNLLLTESSHVFLHLLISWSQRYFLLLRIRYMITFQLTLGHIPMSIYCFFWSLPVFRSSFVLLISTSSCSDDTRQVLWLVMSSTCLCTLYSEETHCGQVCYKYCPQYAVFLGRFRKIQNWLQSLPPCSKND